MGSRGDDKRALLAKAGHATLAGRSGSSYLSHHGVHCAKRLGCAPPPFRLPFPRIPACFYTRRPFLPPPTLSPSASLSLLCLCFPAHGLTRGACCGSFCWRSAQHMDLRWRFAMLSPRQAHLQERTRQPFCCSSLLPTLLHFLPSTWPVAGPQERSALLRGSAALDGTSTTLPPHFYSMICLPFARLRCCLLYSAPAGLFGGSILHLCYCLVGWFFCSGFCTSLAYCGFMRRGTLFGPSGSLPLCQCYWTFFALLGIAGRCGYLCGGCGMR